MIFAIKLTLLVAWIVTAILLRYGTRLQAVALSYFDRRMDEIMHQTKTVLHLSQFRHKRYRHKGMDITSLLMVQARLETVMMHNGCVRGIRDSVRLFWDGMVMLLQTRTIRREIQLFYHDHRQMEHLIVTASRTFFSTFG
jgi:hypothetical protein